MSLLSREKKHLLFSFKEWALSSHAPSVKNLISLLFEDEMAYRLQEGKRREKEQNNPISTFRLRPSTAHKRIQEAAFLSSLFFQGERIRFDPLTHCSLSCTISKKESGYACQVNALLPSLTIPLDASCHILIGPPHFLYTKGILRAFHDEIEKNLLQCLQKNQLTEKDLSLLQDSTGEAFSLTLPHKAPSRQHVSLTPFLHFLDSQFRFAQLSFRYPSGSTYSYPIDPLTPFNQERDKHLEEKEALDVHDVGFLWDAKERQFHLGQDKRNEAIEFLLALGWNIKDCSGKMLLACTKMDIAPILQGNKFTFEGQASFGKEPLSFDLLYQSIKHGKITIPLTLTESGFLGTSLITPIQALLGDVFLHEKKIHLKKNKIGLLQEHFSLGMEQLQRDHILKENNPSCTFHGELRPYQQDGVTWLQKLYERGFSGIIADEMGLGKTVQFLSFLSQHKELIPALIIAPAAILENWRREIHRFCPTLKVLIVKGKEQAQSKEEADVIITSYTTVRMALPHFIENEWSLIALDEAQYCKNSDTLAHEAIKSIRTPMKVLLTGTPIENSISDLASLFSIMDETLLAEEEDLLLTNIKKKVSPYILKRTKKEVAQDLPPLIEETSLIELYEEERVRYDTFVHALKTGALKKISLSKEKPSQVMILEGLLRMRQLVCHPLLFQAEYEKPQLSFSSAKWDTAFSDICQLLEEGKKVLLFSQFVEILSFFSKALKEADLPYFQIDGSTKDRQGIVDQFEQAKKPTVLLASLMAAGVGLNITAADAVLLYDPWWNAAREKQALARAHRIGRKDSVYVKRYIVSNTIEERVFQVREKKEALIKTLFEEENGMEEETSLTALFYEELGGV